MAQKVQVLMEDDLDGSEATETVSFSLDGTEYEIDLNDKHKEELFEVLNPYRTAARKVSYSTRPVRSRTGGRTRSTGPDNTEVRRWAKDNGIEVADRGRVPAELINRYLRRNEVTTPVTEPDNDDKAPMLVAVPTPEFKPAETPTETPTAKKNPGRSRGAKTEKAGDAAG